MYDEADCIYFIDEGKCKLAEGREDFQPCCTCFDKYILREGEETTIVEKRTIKRENGKIINVVE